MCERDPGVFSIRRLTARVGRASPGERAPPDRCRKVLAKSRGTTKPVAHKDAAPKGHALPCDFKSGRYDVRTKRIVRKIREFNIPSCPPKSRNIERRKQPWQS